MPEWIREGPWYWHLYWIACVVVVGAVANWLLGDPLGLRKMLDEARGRRR